MGKDEQENTRRLGPGLSSSRCGNQIRYKGAMVDSRPNPQSASSSLLILEELEINMARICLYILHAMAAIWKGCYATTISWKESVHGEPASGPY